MRLISSVLGLAVCMSVESFAAQLPAIEGIPGDESASQEASFVDCSNAMSQMDSLQQRQNTNHNNATAWSSNVASGLRQWHNDLSKYEGKTITVREGGFDFIDTSANTAVKQTQRFSNAADGIRVDYNRIANVLRNCLNQ
ncbi:MAG: hypothetical protein AB7T49_14175 [Oligoflexales bacterium]